MLLQLYLLKFARKMRKCLDVEVVPSWRLLSDALNGSRPTQALPFKHLHIMLFAVAVGASLVERTLEISRPQRLTMMAGALLLDKQTRVRNANVVFVRQ